MQRIWMREFKGGKWTAWRETGYTKLEYARNAYSYVFGTIPMYWTGNQYEFAVMRWGMIDDNER